jgi:hypothetical protein
MANIHKVMTELSSPLSDGELLNVSFQLPSACHAENPAPQNEWGCPINLSWINMNTGGMTHPLYWENPAFGGLPSGNLT